VAFLAVAACWRSPITWRRSRMVAIGAGMLLIGWALYRCCC
jgi:hypothetical protein